MTLKSTTIKERIILGIDPGTHVMGYGIIRVTDNKPFLVAMGIMKLGKYEDHYIRLAKIYSRMIGLIEEFLPDEMAIEAPFYGKNVQSMLKLGRAQGVAIAAAMAHGSSTIEYAPRKIKQMITGNGNASKEQVWKMLQAQLKFQDDPRYLDATDAVAVALCHYYQSKGVLGKETIPAQQKKKSGNTWTEFIKNNPDRIK